MGQTFLKTPKKDPLFFVCSRKQQSPPFYPLALVSNHFRQVRSIERRLIHHQEQDGEFMGGHHLGETGSRYCLDELKSAHFSQLQPSYCLHDRASFLTKTEGMQ
jgi:hypothetical protein|tara:strand:+ start:1228 stop:1539 length:312 start_codon:yes stop_codon:yes gene_type:complete